ncbi:BnaA09g57190D [Brassica napus]|uniref:(rape) hypothetical protein n=1 Tax=Brassica napus TaxID=3708 RepID=A0A078IUZ5_BRANA|nr:unnamed protein product [Brassica napus]CDY53827.1 BnaA09g57190D [Brassica napus]
MCDECGSLLGLRSVRNVRSSYPCGKVSGRLCYFAADDRLAPIEWILAV